MTAIALFFAENWHIVQNIFSQFHYCDHSFLNSYMSLLATYLNELNHNNNMQYISAGRYTGSYRIPVFIFLTIWIFKIPQYRCHLNNVWNATLLERGLFSLLHCEEDTAVCVTKRERSETEALVECDEREEVMHNIHIDRHKYPPSAASAPACLTNSSSPSIRRIPVNCRVPAFLNSFFIILRL